MLRLGATCSSPQCPKSSSSVCMGGGHGQCGLPASVVRALHMTTATEHNLPNAQHSQHNFEAGGLIPPRSSSSTSRERRSTLFHHAHCRAENRIHLLTPGHRETPRHVTFWHNIGVWPRKRVLYTALTRRSRVQRRALSRFQDIFSTRPRTSSPRRG